MGGYEHEAICVKQSGTLAEPDWLRLRAALQDKSIWAAPARTPLGLDGAEWLLEAAVADRIRASRRWSPSLDGDDAPFRRACEVMLALAGPEVVGSKVY
jgi:hypothetical protein